VRRRILVGLGFSLTAILFAGLAAAVVRVPVGSIGICGGRDTSAARSMRPGWHLRAPFLESCVVLGREAIKVSGSVQRLSPEGAALVIGYRFTLDPEKADPGALLRDAGDGDLKKAARRLSEEFLHEAPATVSRAGTPGGGAAPPGDGPEGGGEGFRVLVERLSALGLVPESLHLDEPSLSRASDRGTPPRSPLESLKGSYAGPRCPVLVVGIDSADWSVMGPMMDRGELPTLGKLKKRGAWGVLKSMTPTLSPLLWTSVVTGKTPDHHGIVDFLARDEATGALVPITSRFRRARALWNILTDLGCRSLTVGWWATWPAERVEGEMITDRVSYSLMDPGMTAGPSGTTYPPALAERVAPLVVPPANITLEEVRRIVDVDQATFDRARASLGDLASWKDPTAHLLRILAATKTYHQIALDRLHAGQPPLTLVYYEGLDEVNHRFIVYQPPAMKWADPSKTKAFAHAVENFYRLQDRLVGELMDAVDPNTIVVVISDHGFASGDRRPTDVPPDIEGKPGRWHTLEGIVIAAGPGIPGGRLKNDPSIMDVAPTLLALLSLPRATDMPGRAIPEIAGGSLIPKPPIAEIATYERPASDRGPVRTPEESAVDAEMLAKLTALGYVGSAGEAPGASGGAPTGGSPTDTATVTGRLNSANALLARSDYPAAERDYRAALDLAPHYVPARLGLAQCLIATGREEEGWRELAAVLEEGGDLDETIYSKVASFYRRRGRAEQGAALFERLPRREGLEAARRANLGVLLETSGRNEDARRELEAALGDDPGCSVALRGIFALLSAKDSYADLIPILESARRARPEGVLAANLLALTLERTGRAPEAAALLEETLKSSPRDVATLANLAGLHLRAGDAAAAIPLLRKAREIDPSNVEVTANLILAHGGTRDLAGARSVFDAAGSLASRVEVLNAMAYASWMNGSVEEARSLLTRSLKQNPDQPEARKLLAAVEKGAAGAPAITSPKGPGL